MPSPTSTRVGYGFAFFSTFLILLWVGLFKFTPTEAEAIRPFVENSPLMSWLYAVGSVQQVSNLIGIIEVVTALMLLGTLWWPRLRRPTAAFLVLTFLTTLSFLFSTPGTFKWVDGFPVTNFLVLKDLSYLGFALWLLHPPVGAPEA